jgi:hypothetical protein
LVYVSPRAELQSVALADGKQRWSVKLEERGEGFCEATDTTIKVLGKDDLIRVVDRADGKVIETVPAQPLKHGRMTHAPCTRIHDDDLVDTGSDHARDLSDKLAIYADRLTVGPGGRVLSGGRKTGTHVPTLVVIDPNDKELLSIPVPADPLGAIERSPEVVAVGEHEVCASYYTDSVAKPQHVACFAIADGKRLWDIEAGGSALRAAWMMNGAVVVASVGKLEVFDVQTGKPRWQFGN